MSEVMNGQQFSKISMDNIMDDGMIFISSIIAMQRLQIETNAKLLSNYSLPCFQRI